MSTFSLMALDTDQVLKAMRKYKDKKATLQQALQIVYRMEPDMIHTINFPSQADEWYWLNNDRPCVFIPDQDTIDALLSGKYSITDPDALVLPHDMFMIAVPNRAYLADGILLEPALVSALGQNEHRENISQFLEYLGMPEKAHTHRTREMRPDELDRGISVSMPATFGEDRQGRSRVSIQRWKIPQILEAKTAQEFGEICGLFKLQQVTPLSDEELAQQWLTVKLVLAMSIYVQAQPDALRAGLPDKVRFSGKRFKDATNSVIRTRKVNRDSPDAHYRSWFFRQLVADRYYQGEHAGKPKGSRIVFVKETVVNREQENETLET